MKYEVSGQTTLTHTIEVTLEDDTQASQAAILDSGRHYAVFRDEYGFRPDSVNVTHDDGTQEGYEIISLCEGCERAIFEGDEGIWSDCEGVYLCAKCGPPTDEVSEAACG